MPEPLEKQISPEIIATPGAGKETAPPSAAPERAASKETAPVGAPLPAPPSEPAPVTPVIADPVVFSIEQILSENLSEHYQAMPPEVRAKFKQKGEETVGKLRQMVRGTVIRVKDVLKLIVAWLKIIPGANKYFLEQESKIKADKIIELHKREHGE